MKKLKTKNHMNWDLSVSWTRTQTYNLLKKKKKTQQTTIQHWILQKRPNCISINKVIKSNNFKKKLQTQWKVER